MTRRTRKRRRRRKRRREEGGCLWAAVQFTEQGTLPLPRGRQSVVGCQAISRIQILPRPPLIPHSGSIEKAEIHEKVVESERKHCGSITGRVFFDDPEIDARVRKVDAPKDQMDKEWDEFQKSYETGFTLFPLHSCWRGWGGTVGPGYPGDRWADWSVTVEEKLRNRQDEIKISLKRFWP